MPGGKTNTQRIETLESQAANINARVNVNETLIEGLRTALDRISAAAQGHTSKITVIENTITIVDLPRLKEAIVELEKDHLALRKELEMLQIWKDELKKQKEESDRRWWSFGPAITAAIVSGILGIIGVLLSIYLNKP